MDRSSPKPSELLARQIVHENPRLRLLEDRVRFHTGREAVHWKVDYARHGVGVVPVLLDGRIVLGLHWRYCTERWSWEIAAGSVEPGEDHEAAALRELEEETGCSDGTIRFLLDYNPAPGLGNEHFHIYIATGLIQSGGPLDTEEIYETRAFHWPEIEAMIEEGSIKDGFTITALLLARTLGLVK